MVNISEIYLGATSYAPGRGNIVFFIIAQSFASRAIVLVVFPTWWCYPAFPMHVKFHVDSCNDL